MSVHDGERMSGGPQVFLGATTFCQIATPPDFRPPRDLRPLRGLPARETWQPSFARCLVSKPGQAQPPSTGTAARPRRPRSGLRSGGADPVSARPSHRPRAPQPGPAGLAAASDQAALIPFRPGPVAAHGHRSQASQASQRPPIKRPLALQEIRRGPAQKRIRAGPLLLALTRQRVSSLLGRCTRRSTPRRRWGGSSRAGWPGADST